MQDVGELQEAIQQFSVFYPFELDPFQYEAIATFLDGDSVMVAAPTGTGKTVVAEFGVYESFRRGGRVMYTTPIKALSNQKYRDLRAIYHDNVGLLTGDVSENNDAPIVVMTTEVLRNMLIQTPWELDAVDCIIFDEVHYIADQERGTTWEEAIILCPEHIQLICLSATVSNAQEIADWIGRTHRPIRLITHNERAVPLSLYYFLDKKLRLVLDDEGNQVADFPHTGGEIRRQLSRNGLSREQRRQVEQSEPPPWEIIQALSARGMLPAIYFLFSRRDCEEYAQRFAVMRPTFAEDEIKRERIEQVVNSYLDKMRIEDRELLQVRRIAELASQGIGFHHAGLLPILKQLVEVLFSQGLMQVVFATDTLALGVNMPARTVIIGRMTKWDGRRRRPLTPNEFQQMAGRAGRRGMDERGTIVVPYSPWMTFREVLDIAAGPLEPVRSSFAIRYNTVLNLWDPPQGSRVRHMLQQSLSQFQAARRVRDLEDLVIEAGREIEAAPHGCLIGLEAGDELLDDYRGLNALRNDLKNRERRLLREIRELRESYDERPWPVPGRQALKRVFRDLPPGSLVHTRDFGWTLFLGRGGIGGVGVFLGRDAIHLIAEYRQIDYLAAAQSPVALPESIIDLHEPPAELSDVLREGEREAIWDEVARRDLPDLDAAIRKHEAEIQDRLGREHERRQAELAAIREQYDEATRRRHDHPCHACLRRKEHQANLRRISLLERDQLKLKADLTKELADEDERVHRLIRGIRDVLHRFGYLHRGYPTAKSDTLANVFDTNGLVICEAIDRGFLDRLPAPDLAEAFSWFAYDRDFRLGNTYSIPKPLVLLRRRLDELEREVINTERNNHLFISTGHNDGFYGAMRAWCLGASMSRILERIELSEGDLVLTFNKTLDLMRQVREMLAHAMPDHPLRIELEQAEEMVKRDIVEQSLTLGFMPLFSAESGDVIEDEDEVIPDEE